MLRWFALAGMIGALVPGAAYADGPWYVSGSVGGYFRESDSIATSFYKTDAPNITAPGAVRRSFDPGVTGNVAVGYELIPQLRVEAELGAINYYGNQINPMAYSANFPRLNGSPFTRQSGDDWSRFTGTINAFYDFPVVPWLAPYVGIGLGGAANNKTTGYFIGPASTPFTSISESSTNGVGLLEGGVSVPLIGDLSITGSYRYMHFFAPGEDSVHIAKIGIRYSF